MSAMRTLAATLLLATALLAGCGADPAAPPEPGAVDPALVQDGPSTDVAAPNPPGPVRLSLSTTELGETVTVDGRTVYRFEADENEPPASICENDCLRAWPPLLSDGGPVQVVGIDPKLVGTFTRADGTSQVTLRGWPLYRFVDDVAPGDTRGEDVGGNWSALGSDGRPLVTR